ncbi:MAG: 16S rRNA (uracil(1498)-N(3))-methyltransferase [Victivallaceae bacterium]|nr:16S rRNA (uracil(1498)-N(3))-methyltransferase [Victivallaceae bacterium]
MHSFFCENISASGEQVELSERDAKHLFRTLRGHAGDTVKLMDGRGKLALAIIMPNKKLKLTKVSTKPDPAIKLHLFIAPPRRHKMDSLLKQCAEIGIWEITPIITERAVALPNKKNDSGDRWQTLLIEGCKQSENPFLPQIDEAISLIDALNSINRETTAIFFGETPRYANGTQLKLHNRRNIAWFVGPEGGFTDSERQLLHNNGAEPFSFGAWILRVETAAICGAAILLRAQ